MTATDKLAAALRTLADDARHAGSMADVDWDNPNKGHAFDCLKASETAARTALAEYEAIQAADAADARPLKIGDHVCITDASSMQAGRCGVIRGFYEKRRFATIELYAGKTWDAYTSGLQRIPTTQPEKQG
jgi:hypothetical protein